MDLPENPKDGGSSRPITVQGTFAGGDASPHPSQAHGALCGPTSEAKLRIIDRRTGFSCSVEPGVPGHGGSNGKIAILSVILPPSWSGQAVALYRILRDWDPEEYCLISLTDYDAQESDSPELTWGTATERLPAQYYSVGQDLPEEPLLNRLRFFLKPFFFWMFLYRLARRTVRIVRVMRREKCRMIVGCTGDLLDPPAALLASLVTSARFAVWMFDDYIYQRLERRERLFARIWERICVRGARQIFVTNEALGVEYRRRYNVETTLIHNPGSETPPPQDWESRAWPYRPHEIRIVYTGSIYYAHFEPLRNTIAAIERLGRTDVKLHLYTAIPRDILEKEGIEGPVVYHGHIPNAEARAIQSQADILLLPLAIHCRNPELLTTATPGKMGEYLSSGRPILVYAPPEFYLARYFRTHQCGFVVDRPDPHVLACAIETICGDGALRHKVIANALNRYAADYDPIPIRDRFRASLGLPRLGSNRCTPKTLGGNVRRR